MVSLRSTLEKPCAPRWQSIFSLPQNWDRLFHSTPPANFPSADTAFSSPLLKLLHSWKAYGCILDYNRLENKGPDFVSLVCCRNRGGKVGKKQTFLFCAVNMNTSVHPILTKLRTLCYCPLFVNREVRLNSSTGMQLLIGGPEVSTLACQHHRLHLSHSGAESECSGSAVSE